MGDYRFDGCAVSSFQYGSVFNYLTPIDKDLEIISNRIKNITVHSGCLVSLLKNRYELVLSWDTTMNASENRVLIDGYYLLPRSTLRNCVRSQ